MATDLPALQPITRLSPLVVRILGGNPGKYTLQGTNTYLVGKGKQRTLVDTGEGKPAWAESLKKVLVEEAATIDRVILTHWHPDHIGGVDDVFKLCPDTKVYKSRLDDRSVGDYGQEDIKNGQKFEIEGASLRAFHSPGHTTDHMALILDEEDAMFTGDNVLGHGTAVFEDLSAYMQSLDQMQKRFNGRAYPGHGEVIDDGRAKIAEYIAHRKKREQEALDVLGRPQDNGTSEWSSMDMVKVIYKGYPESLHLPAQGSLLQVLKKLESEGRVIHEDGKWSISSSERERL
ncbi:hypothetical protein MRB53_038588 [Persea americana]|nr:hypothetical protein MRB53_038588 [Persea americana]